MPARDLHFAFLGRKPRIEFQQLLGVDEKYLLRQLGHNLGKLYIQFVLGHLDGFINAPDNLFEELDVPLPGRDHPLPVPLVHINGMEIVQLLVGPQRIHICINAAACGSAQLGELHPFPFCEGMDNLCAAVGQILYREADRPLGAVEIVVDAGARKHDHRRCYAKQSQLGRQVDLEHIFYCLDGLFGIFGGTQEILISGRDEQGHLDCFYRRMQVTDNFLLNCKQ